MLFRSKGSKVTIVFPDRVKGGEQPTSHRKVSIKLILQELYAAGVEKKDILLICSNGLHRKNTEQEIRGVLGDELFNQFWGCGQIINHDSEDYEHLVDLGTTDTLRTSGDNSVDVVAGATATSKAITAGVNRALNIVANLDMGGEINYVDSQ